MLDENGYKLPFPYTRDEAIALLYVQSQDLSGKTPTDISIMFNKALREIKDKG